jgi:hypothetical protein
MPRMNFVARFLLCLCLVGSSLASDTWVVRFDGVGPVKIGMSVSQLNGVLREKFSMPVDKTDQGCFYLKSRKHPHTAFMIENGRLVRIDVEEPGVSTSEGIRVGDLESRALKVYGPQLKVSEHQYIESGHYLTIRSNSGRYGIRFETDQGKVTTFYAGQYDAIQYVEGCE